MRLLMRRGLGTPLASLVLATGLVLGGCGDDSGGVAQHPVPTSEGAVDFTEVALLSQTAVGGRAATEPVVLDTEQARAEFAARFSDERMGEAIDHAVATADVPEGQELVGAVVAIGCDVPDEVSVESSARGLQITADEPARPTEECLAAMTTVALVAVDSSLV